MIIDLTALNFSKEKKVDINETHSFSEEELKNSGILKLENIKINGYISRDDFDEYNIYLNIKGIAVVPSSITLNPVDYPLDIIVDENLEEIQENFKKNQKSIDILPIIWENILMEIPIRITGDEENVITKGDGWELITDRPNPNNGLAKLKDLF